MRARSTNGTGTLCPPPRTRSLDLPLLLGLFGIAMVRKGLGVDHAAMWRLPRLRGALARPSGFRWPAGARRRKPPWMLFGALDLAAVDALDTPRWEGTLTGC